MAEDGKDGAKATAADASRPEAAKAAEAAGAVEEGRRGGGGGTEAAAPAAAAPATAQECSPGSTPTAATDAAPEAAPTRPLKFTHVTKCAGSTIEDIGLKAGLKWGRHNEEEQGFWHHEFSLVPREVQERYDWFMVVRNPFERMVSEVLCKWGGVGKHGRRYGTGDLNRILRSKISRRHELNSHGQVRLGYHYLEMNRYEGPRTHVLHFENLEAEFDALMARYGISARLSDIPPVNRTARKYFTVADLDPASVRAIQEAYAEDFRRYGYSLDVRDAPGYAAAAAAAGPDAARGKAPRGDGAARKRDRSDADRDSWRDGQRKGGRRDREGAPAWSAGPRGREDAGGWRRDPAPRDGARAAEAGDRRRGGSAGGYRGYGGRGGGDRWRPRGGGGERDRERGRDWGGGRGRGGGGGYGRGPGR